MSRLSDNLLILLKYQTLELDFLGCESRSIVSDNLSSYACHTKWNKLLYMSKFMCKSKLNGDSQCDVKSLLWWVVRLFKLAKLCIEWDFIWIHYQIIVKPPTAHSAAAVDCDRAEVREQKTSELYCQHISIFRSHNAQLEGRARCRHGFLGDQ